MTASQPFFLFCHMMNVFIIIRSFTQGVYNRLPFFAHCTRDFIALVMDEPQLPHAGVAQAQAAIDAENHAAPPLDQPQAQPNTEPLPAATSLPEVSFFFIFNFSLLVLFLFKFVGHCFLINYSVSQGLYESAPCSWL